MPTHGDTVGDNLLSPSWAVRVRVWRPKWRGMLSTWPIWAIADDDLIWRRIAGAAGLMPTDGGGNLITLAGRVGAI